MVDPRSAPEVLLLRESIRSWRFYDHFRTDAEAPARQLQVGTRAPALSHDGRDVAAALQTIREIGDGARLDEAGSAKVLHAPHPAIGLGVKAAGDLGVTRIAHVDVMTMGGEVRSWALVPHHL